MIPYHVRELLGTPWTSVVRRNLVANLTYLTYVNNTLPLALAVHEISRHFWATMVQRASEFSTSQARVFTYARRCDKDPGSGWSPGVFLISDLYFIGEGR